MPAEIRTTEAVLDELASVERDWGRVLYIPFEQRRAVMRYARVGAFVEQLANQTRGPVSDELRRLIAMADEGRP